jgi:hypothetical protein
MRRVIRMKDRQPFLPSENKRDVAGNEESIMNTRNIVTFAALGVMALMACARSAGASDLPPKYGHILLDGHCDDLQFYFAPSHQARMIQGCPDVQTGVGVGMTGRVTGVYPKDITLGVLYYDAPPGTVYLYNVQYPLVTGNSWSIFSTTDGVNFSPVDSGTYTVLDADAAHYPQEGPPAIPALRK